MRVRLVWSLNVSILTELLHHGDRLPKWCFQWLPSILLYPHSVSHCGKLIVALGRLFLLLTKNSVFGKWAIVVSEPDFSCLISHRLLSRTVRFWQRSRVYADKSFNRYDVIFFGALGIIGSHNSCTYIQPFIKRGRLPMVKMSGGQANCRLNLIFNFHLRCG